MPTLPSVEPKPFSNCLMTSGAGSPDARPTTPEPMISAMKAWNLNELMRTTMIAMLAAAQTTSQVSWGRPRHLPLALGSGHPLSRSQGADARSAASAMAAGMAWATRMARFRVVA